MLNALIVLVLVDFSSGGSIKSQTPDDPLIRFNSFLVISKLHALGEFVRDAFAISWKTRVISTTCWWLNLVLCHFYVTMSLPLNTVFAGVKDNCNFLPRLISWMARVDQKVQLAEGPPGKSNSGFRNQEPFCGIHLHGLAHDLQQMRGLCGTVYAKPHIGSYNARQPTVYDIIIKKFSLQFKCSCQLGLMASSHCE